MRTALLRALERLLAGQPGDDRHAAWPNLLRRAGPGLAFRCRAELSADRGAAALVVSWTGPRGSSPGGEVTRTGMYVDLGRLPDWGLAKNTGQSLRRTPAARASMWQLVQLTRDGCDTAARH